jgi:hypothetical protein
VSIQDISTKHQLIAFLKGFFAVKGATGGSPGGSDSQIQYNDAGSFGGSADFKWTGTAVEVTGAVVVNSGDRGLHISGAADATLLDITYDGASATAPALTVTGSNVGIGVSDPDCLLEILAASGRQLKLSENGTDNVTFDHRLGRFTISVDGGGGDPMVVQAGELGVVDGGYNLTPTAMFHASSSFDNVSLLRLDSAGNGCTLFVTGSGRVGIGTEEPDYTLHVAGDVGVDQSIRHNGDNDTRINFTDDRIRFDAGGLNLFGMHKKGSAPHQVTVNNGGNNVDFVINDNNSDVYFRADADEGRIGIWTEEPKTALSVVHDYATTTFENQLSDNEGGGHILKYGTGTLTAGKLYYLHTDASWNVTDLDDVTKGASQLLGIALGSSPTSDGMLLKGYAKIASGFVNGAAAIGQPVYVAGIMGEYTFTIASGTGDFVRVVGYCIDIDSSDILLYFDPDSTYIEIS